MIISDELPKGFPMRVLHLQPRTPLVSLSLVIAMAAVGFGCQPVEEAPAPAIEATEVPVVVVEEAVAVDGAEAQIAAAVLAAPPSFREAARVRGYASDGNLVLIRAGDNGMTCLADDPSDDRFQVACYQNGLEDYMARGRALRAEGITGSESLAARHEEIDAGTLSLPDAPVCVYTLGGPVDAYDAGAGEIDEARSRRVYALYTPYATGAELGLSETPLEPGAPWIMRPGTPSSHIMVVPPRPELADAS